MPHHLRNILTPAQLTDIRRVLDHADWQDGRVTAGSQSAQVKNNLQLDEQSNSAAKLRQLVLSALSQHANFFSAALPRRIYPPLFNCYQDRHNAFGSHVDNAIRTHPASAQSLRTDLSFTLFLSEPDEYEGGELVIESSDAPAMHAAVKLPAGDLLLYPAFAVHHVSAVTRGRRLACFSWVESLVRDPQQRQILHDLDTSIIALREQSESPETLRLTNCYHNLMRLWASP